jgi:hypothetical protein
MDVPNVFIMICVVPDSRVGRKACGISITRLTAVPSRIVVIMGREAHVEA